MKRILILLLSALLLIPMFTACSTNKEVEEKTKVGISWAMPIDDAKEDEDINAYISAIEMTGGEAILLPEATSLDEAKENLKNVDCIIMAGGEDVNPELYGEEMLDVCEEPYNERDTSDKKYVLAAMELDMPLLGTCRGMQILNVVCGGTLYQDLFTQYDTDINHRDPNLEDFTYHKVNILEGNILADALGVGEFEVNSWHHQGIKTVGENLEVIATAPDGMVEGIVYKNASYIYGVQFHPEWHMVENTLDCTKIFTDLYAACK